MSSTRKTSGSFPINNSRHTNGLLGEWQPTSCVILPLEKNLEHFVCLFNLCLNDVLIDKEFMLNRHVTLFL